jgi:hypothetical protein
MLHVYVREITFSAATKTGAQLREAVRRSSIISKAEFIAEITALLFLYLAQVGPFVHCFACLALPW